MLSRVLAVGAFAPTTENVGRKTFTVQLETPGFLAAAFLGGTLHRVERHHGHLSTRAGIVAGELGAGRCGGIHFGV